MPDHTVWNEPLVEQTVTYRTEIDGRLLLVENIPTRPNLETGERYFAPETVERLQQAMWVCPSPTPGGWTLGDG